METNIRRRVLVITRDMIPAPGLAVMGGGLRAWSLGEALRRCGHEVVYSVPRSLLPEGECDETLRRLAFEVDDLNGVILKAEPDVVLVEQWDILTYMPRISLPLVVDLHGSLILENAFRQHRSLVSNAAAKIKALNKVDLVVCPSRRQQAYFMAWLMMTGVDPRQIPVEVVPLSLPFDPLPRETAVDGELQLIYGGNLWPWIDSRLALSAATQVLEQRGAGTLSLFVAAPNTHHCFKHDSGVEITADALPEEVFGSKRVTVEGVIPRDELLKRYSHAHLALDVYSYNTERLLAYTTRTVEYLWCGLPVVYGDYGELADLIREYEAGWVVDPSDPAAISAALEQAADDRVELERRAQNTLRLVQGPLGWERAIAPLERYIRHPLLREKGLTIFGQISLEFDRIKEETQQENQLLTGEVAALKEEQQRRDRQMETHVELHNSNMAEAHRAADLIQRELAEAQAELTRSRELEHERSRLREMLQEEMEQHRQTAALLERRSSELAIIAQRLDGREIDLQQVQNDLKSALTKLEAQDKEHYQDLDRLGQGLREAGERELDLRREIAEGAILLSDAQAQQENERRRAFTLEAQLTTLKQRIETLSWTRVQRILDSGTFVWRRIAIQTPGLAGLWARNLANNAYQTLLKKRKGLTIFPGQ